EELFDESGAFVPELAALAPEGRRRMSGNPKTNGGLVLRDLHLPDFRRHAVDVQAPATVYAEATRVLGSWLAEVVERNPENFHVFGPDETASNRLGDLLNVTAKQWDAAIEPVDEHLAPHGRVVEMLSEHQCQGWLEGYLLTGRHGLFNCYEAFIHIIDSMFNQHAKWLKVTRDIPWRRPIASLNYLLSSHVWRQDHNGFSHQDPGFIDHVVNKKAEIIRVYLPPDANCLLSVADHCLSSRHYVNVIVAGKQPALDYLSMDEAIVHCTRGLGIWKWASNDGDGEPDVVLACCGDIPTLEALAAAAILRERLPDVKVRFVNVVDLMRLQPESEHPHGIPEHEFDALFTTDKPVVFAYHGYPWLIHRLTYRHANHNNLHVRGYKEEGTTTTPFDMVMLNDLDRFHLVIDVIDRVPGLADRRPGSGRTWSMRGCAPAHTRASTARTIPRSAASAGPRNLARERGPRRERGLDEPQVVARRRRGAVAGNRAARGGPRECDGRRAPHRPRRRTFPRPRGHRRRGRARACGARRSRAAPRATRDRCRRPGAPGARRSPPRRRLRHRLPCDASTGGVDLCASRALPRGARDSALRLPRPLGRMGRWMRSGAAARRVPPRRRLLRVGGARRPVGRHDHGLHAARRGADGDAIRLGRSRGAALPAAKRVRRRRRARGRAGARVGAARARRKRESAGAVRKRGARRLRVSDRVRRRRDGGRARRSRRARLHRRRRRAFGGGSRARLRAARVSRRGARLRGESRRARRRRRRRRRITRARGRAARARGRRRRTRGAAHPRGTLGGRGPAPAAGQGPGGQRARRLRPQLDGAEGLG